LASRRPGQASRGTGRHTNPAAAAHPFAGTYGGWEAVENASIALAEAANLVALPGRTCANGKPVPLNDPTFQKGLAALRAQSFDVVLTDIEMPDMNGFEFAEVIRSDNNLGQMPIIALSAMVSPAAIERGRQAGFHDYVAKFDRPGLIAALKEQTADVKKAA